MRKITKNSVNAFFTKDVFNTSNTEVKFSGSVSEMYLHGNLIATYNHDTKELKICDCGYMTQTTKERLNGILAKIGKGIYQKSFQWFLSDGSIFKNCNEKRHSRNWYSREPTRNVIENATF